MTGFSLGRLRITSGFLLGVSLFWVLGSESVLLPLLAAGVCHELGHLLAALRLGLEVQQLRLSLSGAELKLPGRARCVWWQEALLLAAGPAVNLLLGVLCCRSALEPLELFGAVNLLLGCFNLLPVPPLDGGGLLAVLFARLLPAQPGLRLADGAACVTRGLLLGLGAFLALEGNVSLLLLALWLLGQRNG